MGASDMSDPRTIIIRRASPLDASNVIRLVDQTPGANEARLMHWTIEVISRGFVAVADVDRRIVGSVGVMTVTAPFQSAPHLETVWFAVVPAFVRRGTGDTLLEAAEQFADGRGLPLVVKTGDQDLITKLCADRGYLPGQTLLARPVMAREKAT